MYLLRLAGLTLPAVYCFITIAAIEALKLPSGLKAVAFVGWVSLSIAVALRA
jgi:molybdopterin-binding protein